MLDFFIYIDVRDQSDLNSTVGAVEASELTCHVNVVNGSDGGISVIVEVLDFVSTVLPHVTTFLLGYLAQRKVRKIKIGDWEIDNPDQNMLDLIEKRMKMELAAVPKTGEEGE